jgi:hypothetical protein
MALLAVFAVRIAAGNVRFQTLNLGRLSLPILIFMQVAGEKDVRS